MPATVSIVLSCLMLVILLAMGCPGQPESGKSDADIIQLPPPDTTGSVAVEQTIAQRRSVRAFTDQALTNEQMGQLLWAAQGITEPRRGLRAAPSAGALYPLELYVVTTQGVYHYLPEGHRLQPHLSGNRMSQLAQACLGQQCVEQAAANFVITAVYERTAGKYGGRAQRYVDIEVGAAGENLYLQAVALDLGAVMVGAFQDEAVTDTLQLPTDYAPVLVIPVGHPR